MADDIQPELDAETLRKIEEEVQAQFAEHEPVLDEETLKQIEAQVNAEFDSAEPEVDPSTVETQVPEVAATQYQQPPVYEQPQASVAPPQVAPQPAVDPFAQPAAFDPNATTAEETVIDPAIHQQPTDLDMNVGYGQQAPQFEQPQIQVQPMAIQQPVYEEPAPAPAPAAYQEPAPAYEEPVYQEPAPVYEEPAPAPAPAPKKTGGPKKKKLKGGGKTRVNMGSKGPNRAKTKVELEEVVEEEPPARSTRAAGRRTGRRKVQEEPPKKGKAGLIIGIVAGVLVAVVIVVVIMMNGSKQEVAEPEVTQVPEKPAVEEKAEPPKPVEKSFATGAWNTQDFRTMVLRLINKGKLEDAETYIKSRKKDAPDEDLGYLEKRLKLARGN